MVLEHRNRGAALSPERDMIVYRPHGLYAAAVDPERCKYAVHDEGRGCGFHQCSRRPKRNGWCGQHHPDAEAARKKASGERYDNQMRCEKSARVASGLRAATTDELRGEMKRRGLA